jgi:pimeloyl-ACP methyl ester carboxylesterase
MSTQRQKDGWLLVEETPDTVRHRALLIPGLQGSDRGFSRLLVEPALSAAGVQVIAGNPPGFKGQPVPAGFDFTVEAFAQLVERLAEAEKIDLMVGHSFGANVLIEVAARGTFAGKLLLISPSLDRQAESKDLKSLDGMSRTPLLRSVIWWVTYQMMKSVYAPYIDDPALLAGLVEDGRRIPRDVGRRVLTGYFDHLDRHGSLLPRLATTRVPVAYVRGDRCDIGFTPAHRDGLAACPKISLHEIPGARHFAMVDKPAAVADVMVELLARK